MDRFLTECSWNMTGCMITPLNRLISISNRLTSILNRLISMKMDMGKAVESNPSDELNDDRYSLDYLGRPVVARGCRWFGGPGHSRPPSMLGRSASTQVYSIHGR